jgi:predicted ArsR family transcriptional regulator
VLSPASGYSGAVGSDPGAPPTVDRATGDRSDRPSDATILPSRDILKVLGDNTRYAIYLELARAARPLVTAEIAESLGLHPNTVRPHLDRMREVGLLDVTTGARGEVGRPQHRYSLAAEAPSFGLEPPTVPVLARMVLNMADRLRASAADAAAVGETEGSARAAAYVDAPSALEALVADLDRLGFDPVVAEGDDPDHAVVAFANCPFSAYTETHQDLVCGLHRGLVTGFVDTMGDAEVVEFCSVVHRTPCQVQIAARVSH